MLRGLGLGSGDEIVTTTDEHFGLLGPVAASGATVVVVAPDPEAILAAVTPRTGLIATSQVLWTSGAVLPLAEVRERSGVPVLADGAQSVGAIPSTAAGVDFLTIAGQVALRAGLDRRAGRRGPRPARRRLAELLRAAEPRP